jgi:hypothetical protein
MSRSRLWAAVVAAGFLVLAATARHSAAAELVVAGRGNANASIAAAGQFVAIAWGAASVEGATDVYAATSRDGGGTFGPPARVSDQSTLANLAGEQPPRVTLVPRAGADPSVVIVWTSRGPAGTRLLSARSIDGGRSFTRPAVLPGGDAAGNRGWHAFTTARDGHVIGIWLDHRETVPAAGAPAMNHAGHDPATHAAQKADGVARAQLSKLHFADMDGGTSRALTGGVCYCCKTSIAAGADGSVYAVWRHVYPGNVRDIAVTVSRDGGRTFEAPVRVSDDRWVLDGCPENGPAIAVDAQRRIHVVWPTLIPGATPTREATLGLFYASSTDGRRFTPRQSIPTEGVPRHPQIALRPDGVVVTWDEQAGGTRRVVVGRGTWDPRGTLRFTREVVADAAPATYPVVAATGDGIVLAWTSGTVGKTVIRTEKLRN